jgi:hypothetical protein
MARIPSPITRDQEYYSQILMELRELRLLIEAVRQAVSGESIGYKCEICGKVFQNQRALRAHMRVHKEG